MPSGRPISRLPTVRRDLAIVVDEQVPAQDILDALDAMKPAQIEQITLFDVYRGMGIDRGKKSLAILVLIQDTARTLTDAEIDAAVAVLLRELENRFEATLRQ
jgi:phenylalanyl-tRNA synthetase beta chain